MQQQNNALSANSGCVSKLAMSSVTAIIPPAARDAQSHMSMFLLARCWHHGL